jgi:hypothetical protein
MIYAMLNGGLGNQLFQYAAARALAIKHQTQVVLDDYLLQSVQKKVTSRVYELNNFNVECSLADSRRLVWERRITRFPKMFHKLTKRRVYCETSRGFDYRVKSLPDDVYLRGYWQSYRYFSDIKPELIKEISINRTHSPYVAKLLQGTFSTDSVAVHVRRGDYVSLENAAKFHGVLSVDYYIKASSIINKVVKTPLYFIFSDDIRWCKEHLIQHINNVLFVGDELQMQPWEDFDLMKNCKHHIIANSSFSWWSAWLSMETNYGMDRVVIAPKQWYANQKTDFTADRIPEDWIIL